MLEDKYLFALVVALFFLCCYYVDEFIATILKALFILITMIAVSWIVAVISAAIIAIQSGDLPWWAEYLGIFNWHSTKKQYLLI